jgi:hypothetical protein
LIIAWDPEDLWSSRSTGSEANEISSLVRRQVLAPQPTGCKMVAYEADGHRHQLPPHKHVLYPLPGCPFSLGLGIDGRGAVCCFSLATPFPTFGERFSVRDALNGLGRGSSVTSAWSTVRGREYGRLS